MPWRASRPWHTRWPTRSAGSTSTNIACGLLGAPLGFAVIYIVSKLGKEPSAEMQAYVDDIRKPRGRTVLEEKTT